MLRSRLLNLLLAVGCLAGAGCATGRDPIPSAPSKSPDEILHLRAAVLRAQDRRVVDEALLAALDDPLPELRTVAVRTLGRIGDPQYGARLKTALEDDEPSVRAEALFALALLGGENALIAIEGLAEDANLRVRAYVATGLGVLKAAASADTVLTLLADREPLVTVAACYAVSQFDNADFAVERLIELSASDDDTVFVASAHALSRLAADTDHLGFDSRRRARQRLQELTRSRNSFVRAQAARGLAVPLAEGEEQALGPLVEDPDPMVRIAAVRAFSFVGAPLDPYLVKAIDDEDERVVLAAVLGMSRIKGPDAYESLVNLIVFDERQWLREAATRALSTADRVRAATSANGLSKDERWEIRRASAGLLLGQSDELSLEIARRLASDADKRVRLAAIPALAGAPQPLSEVLGDLLDADDPRLQVAVARALAWRLSLPEIDAEQRDEAFALLDAQWAASADASVQGELLDAAARAGALEPAHDFLVRALDTPDYRVRLKAIDHLKELFGEDRSDAAAGASDRSLEDYVDILRWASKPKAAVVTVERAGFLPGRFTIRLHTESAPMTSWNFARMVDEGLFNGRRFSRVFPGFVAQHGDPDAVDRLGIDRAALSEPSADWFREGTLAMVTPAPGLAGPEWFYTLMPQPQLLARYTPFASVTQNFFGVAARVLPGDHVVSIQVYDGDGTELLR